MMCTTSPRRRDSYGSRSTSSGRAQKLTTNRKRTGYSFRLLSRLPERYRPPPIPTNGASYLNPPVPLLGARPSPSVPFCARASPGSCPAAVLLPERFQSTALPLRRRIDAVSPATINQVIFRLPCESTDPSPSRQPFVFPHLECSLARNPTFSSPLVQANPRYRSTLPELSSRPPGPELRTQNPEPDLRTKVGQMWHNNSNKERLRRDAWGPVWQTHSVLLTRPKQTIPDR